MYGCHADQGVTHESLILKPECENRVDDFLNPGKLHSRKWRGGNRVRGEDSDGSKAGCAR